ncbi:MAG: glycine cleavage system protein GcvH [Archangium sp.]|nr:glycine cleavage system protein GcvH [Archangium sp.]
MANGEYPKDLKYTKDHEWAKKTGSAIQVGVTFHAQDALGAVVYVELPKVGTAVTAGAQFGVIESTKAVSELYSPLTGKVVKVNDAVVSNPSLVNEAPYAGGWLIEVESSNAAEWDALMDADTYTKTLG